MAINDPQLGAKYASFLLTHDTVMGRFEGEVSTSTERDDCFLIDGEPVHVTQRTDPGEVPWGASGEGARWEHAETPVPARARCLCDPTEPLDI